MAKYLAGNSNKDISCQAIALIAAAANFALENRAALMNKFLTLKSADKTLAVVKNFYIDERDLKKIQYESKIAQKGGKLEKDKILRELLEAFDENSPKKAEKKIEMDDLLNAFGGKDAKEDSNEDSVNAVPRFIELLEQQLKQTKNKDIAFYCAVTLSSFNNDKGVNYLLKVFESQPAEKKEKIIYTFERNKVFTDKTRAIAKKALRDKNNNVVKMRYQFYA